ncbi:Cytochrome P450 52A13 [Neolecta irregularis DAH-3]|uniref:Cytochrome P450 52A13 n=1 Tax=Neolecta irregularis (strain DAH-3) TaxID=1198029 RepID=A0A1U7LSE3_NEOID|nr:Cytochrome P450 52A13 [Neolecta irregularis DAH-3]|eukprot:OLL25596.1 Cytochrome P450 52A13 [Neolecta irregularis DAH-3]
MLITICAVLCLTWFIWFSRGLSRRKVTALDLPRYRNRYPLGLDGLYRFYRSLYDDTFYETMQSLYSEYGHTFNLRALGIDFYFTDDPENIKAMLATQYDDFGKGPAFNAAFYPFLGDGIFNADKIVWQSARHLLRPLFARERISHLDFFERHFQLLLNHIPDGETVDLLGLFMRLALDIITEYLTGDSVGSLKNDENEFAVVFDAVQLTTARRASLGRLYFLASTVGYRKNLDKLEDFLKPYIEESIKLGRGSNNDNSYHFTAALCEYTTDHKVIRDQIMSLLLAGRDTTATALSWTFYELARSQPIWTLLRNEVSKLRGQKPTFDNLKSMKYLQAVISETLRLYPSVPHNVRASMKETTLPRGGGPDGNEPVICPKGTTINFTIHTMHTREDLWGPDASIFRPERWLNSSTSTSWIYLPFK